MSAVCSKLKAVYSLVEPLTMVEPHVLKFILNTLKKSPPFYLVNANIKVYFHSYFDYED